MGVEILGNSFRNLLICCLYSISCYWKQPSMIGALKLCVLEAASHSRPWRVAADWLVIILGAQHVCFPALCFVLCCDDSLSLLMSRAKALAPDTQQLGEAKPCSYPEQDPGEEGCKECWPGHVSWITASRAALAGKQCCLPSLHLTMPKPHSSVIYACMNGNSFLFGHQCTNKQVKMRLYTGKIQLVSEEDVINSMWSRTCSLLSFASASRVEGKLLNLCTWVWRALLPITDSIEGCRTTPYLRPGWRGLIQILTGTCV